MNLLREKLKALGQHRAMGGGGGGGGGGGDSAAGIGEGIGPSAGPGAGPGAPGTGPASNSDVGMGPSGGPSVGQIGSIFGAITGIPNASMIGIPAVVANAVMGMHGLSSPGTTATSAGGVPGGIGGPNGSFGSGGSGMATGEGSFDQQGNFIFNDGQMYTAQQVQMFRPDLLQQAQTFGGAMGPPGAGGWTGQGATDGRMLGNQPFDAERYYQANPDVRAAGMDAWQHYIQYGQAEGRGMAPAPGGAPAPGQPAAPAPAAAPSMDDSVRQAQMDLVNQQRQIAEEMLRRQNLLEPALLANQGYEQITDASGKVTGYRLSAAAQAQRDQEAQIQNQMRTRTLAALAGELPVDPALNREIEQNRMTLRDSLRGNLGTGFETSTPGIQALADFEKRAEELREASRRDQLRAGEGIRLAGEQLQSQIGSQTFGNIAGLGQLGTNAANIFQGAGTGLSNIGSNLLGNRQLTLQEILGRLGAQTSLDVARIGGQGATDRLGMQLGAADAAGRGQLFGSLATSLLGTQAGRDSIGSAVDWFSGLF